MQEIPCALLTPMNALRTFKAAAAGDWDAAAGRGNNGCCNNG